MTLREVPCPACNGTGLEEKDEGTRIIIKPCKECMGTRVKFVEVENEDNDTPKG